MTSQKNENQPDMEKQLNQALEFRSQQVSRVIVDGKEVAAFYPDKMRVVLSTSRRQSSIPFSVFQNIEHLFNSTFAEELAPLIGVKGNVKS